MRNRELMLPMAIWAGITGGIVWWIYPISAVAAWIACGGMVACLVLFSITTKRRYTEIAKLSSYLARLSVDKYPLDLRNNRPGELSILKNDIYKLSTALYSQAEQLKADKGYLSQAMSNISHQLKTPLTGLMVTVDLLESENISPEKRREFIRTMEEQLERIRWMVRELLKFSRIDAGVVAYRRDDISMEELIRRAVAPLLIPLELQGIELKIQCPSEAKWEGDMLWTSEAVGNIVKNAMEHSPAGGTIGIKVEENPLHIAMTVTDEGEGIPKEDLPNLFTRFYKGKNSTGDSVGIGLAMARTVLRSQNGDIIAYNREGKGSAFILSFYKQIV